MTNIIDNIIAFATTICVFILSCAIGVILIWIGFVILRWLGVL